MSNPPMCMYQHSIFHQKIKSTQNQLHSFLPKLESTFKKKYSMRNLELQSNRRWRNSHACSCTIRYITFISNIWTFCLKFSNIYFQNKQITVTIKCSKRDWMDKWLDPRKISLSKKDFIFFFPPKIAMFFINHMLFNTYLNEPIFIERLPIIIRFIILRIQKIISSCLPSRNRRQNLRYRRSSIIRSCLGHRQWINQVV